MTRDDRTSVTAPVVAVHCCAAAGCPRWGVPTGMQRGCCACAFPRCAADDDGGRCGAVLSIGGEHYECDTWCVDAEDRPTPGHNGPSRGGEGRMTKTPKWADIASSRDFLIIRTLTEQPGWLLKRVVPRIKIDEATCCHLWTGGHNGVGHGKVALPRSIATTSGGTTVKVYTHRIAMILELDGPVPFGMTLDHICRTRLCCNPAHLEVKSVRDNNLAPGSLCSEHQKSKTMCPRGHDLTDPGNWRPDVAAKGRRGCLTCKREHSALLAAASKRLGITQREYSTTFGHSRANAERVLGGWAHGNRQAQAIWTCGTEESR